MATYIFKEAHTAPELISLDDVKEQLKLEAEETSEDKLLTHYRDAAIKFAEDYANRSFNQEKYAIWQNDFENMYHFPKAILSAIDKIEYLDTSGDWQELDAAMYTLLMVDDYQSLIQYNTDDTALPTLKSGDGSRVKIYFTVGYASYDELPEQDKQAIYLVFTFFYEKRDDSVQQLPRASTNLLQRFHPVIK